MLKFPGELLEIPVFESIFIILIFVIYHEAVKLVQN